MLTLIPEGWGANQATFRQVFSTLFMPEATKVETGWFNELQQVSASGENAACIFQAVGAIDVRKLSPGSPRRRWCSTPPTMLSSRSRRGVLWPQAFPAPA